MGQQIKYLPILFLAMLITSCKRDEINPMIDDGIPPSVPSGFQVYYSSDGQIGIEWFRNNEPDVMLYEIFIGEDNEQNLILTDSTTNIFFVFSDLDYETEYFFKIRAVDQSGMKSGFSSVISSTPGNRFRPYAPYEINVNARNWFDSLSIYLVWPKPIDGDISHYEIYRSELKDFQNDSTNLIAITGTNQFTDKMNLRQLAEYYYKIITVDRGNLKSTPSGVYSDVILDKPELISPSNNSNRNYFNQLTFKTVSRSARYKLVIQTNPNFGIVEEKSFNSSKTDEVISIEFNSYFMTSYQKYYWRIFTYTNDLVNPNSISDMFSFTIVPE
ncbi:MAG: hypothetical protein K9G44_02450 [Melioribacteraceae bacterium]|nr:hypothetical protein [Melioribacteraceae bacterium]